MTLDKYKEIFNAWAADPDFNQHPAPEPPKSLLDEAPIVESWHFTRFFNGTLRMIGFVFGHPLVKTGEFLSSGIRYLDPDAKWAMSESRIFLLGSPYDPMEVLNNLAGKRIALPEELVAELRKRQASEDALAAMKEAEDQEADEQ